MSSSCDLTPVTLTHPQAILERQLSVSSSCNLTSVTLTHPQAILERQLSVSSACDYEVDSDTLRHAECVQTWRVSQPSADDVQVVVR